MKTICATSKVWAIGILISVVGYFAAISAADNFASEGADNKLSRIFIGVTFGLPMFIQDYWAIHLPSWLFWILTIAVVPLLYGAIVFLVLRVVKIKTA